MIRSFNGDHSEMSTPYAIEVITLREINASLEVNCPFDLFNRTNRPIVFFCLRSANLVSLIIAGSCFVSRERSENGKRKFEKEGS